MEEKQKYQRMRDARCRKQKVVSGIVVLGLSGLFYLVVIKIFHIGISCPFYRLTGLRCPGCGVSRLCMALVRFRMREAFLWNPVLFLLLPMILILLGRIAVRYVRTGEGTCTKGEQALTWGMIATLLVWGVARNVLGI